MTEILTCPALSLGSRGNDKATVFSFDFPWGIPRRDSDIPAPECARHSLGDESEVVQERVAALARWTLDLLERGDDARLRF
jgi:hypothetical protein